MSIYYFWYDSLSSEKVVSIYPGNNPAIYGDGLDAMRASIERNLELIAAKR